MDSTDLSFSLLSKVPLTWKREYRDRYHARQRMRLVRASSIIQINIDPWLFLFGFNLRCRGLCAFGRAPSQHGVTVLTVRSDGMTCSPGQIQKPRNPNFMRFLPISPGRRGRGKMALPSRVFRAIFTRSSHLLDDDLEGILCTTGRNEHPCKEIRQACPIRTYASKLRKILCQISSARDKLFLTSSFGNFRNVLLRNTLWRCHDQHRSDRRGGLFRETFALRRNESISLR